MTNDAPGVAVHAQPLCVVTFTVVVVAAGPRLADVVDSVYVHELGVLDEPPVGVVGVLGVVGVELEEHAAANASAAIAAENFVDELTAERILLPARNRSRSDQGAGFTHPPSGATASAAGGPHVSGW